MRYFFVQSEGKLYDQDGLVSVAYSGFGVGKNNPAYEEVADVGPIPAGEYVIGAAEDHPLLGPIARPLLPKEGTNTHGRSGFFCHGDSIENPGRASHGCLIAPHDVRAEMLVDDTLSVVHGTSDLGAAMGAAA